MSAGRRTALAGAVRLATIRLLALASMNLLAPGALAQGAPAQGVLVDRSEIRFVAQITGANVEGRFRTWTAEVAFLPDAPQRSKVDLRVDLGSVELGSAEFEAELRGRAWFDAARFPIARFVSTSVRDLGGGRYEIAGTLTMKGASRPCVAPVTLRTERGGERVAEGRVTVRRLDYRIGEGAWADTDAVRDEVSIVFRMVLSPAR